MGYWNTRRKAIHEGIFESPFPIMAMVNHLIQEFDFVKGSDLSSRDVLNLSQNQELNDG
jgi:hypothetical protein